MLEGPWIKLFIKDKFKGLFDKPFCFCYTFLLCVCWFLKIVTIWSLLFWLYVLNLFCHKRNIRLLQSQPWIEVFERCSYGTFSDIQTLLWQKLGFEIVGVPKVLKKSPFILPYNKEVCDKSITLCDISMVVVSYIHITVNRSYIIWGSKTTYNGGLKKMFSSNRISLGPKFHKLFSKFYCVWYLYIG